MTDPTPQAWVITFRRAGETALQTMTVKNGTLVGATKAAQVDLRSRKDGLYVIVSVETADTPLPIAGLVVKGDIGALDTALRDRAPTDVPNA